MNYSAVNNHLLSSFLGIIGDFVMDIKAAINIITKNSTSVIPQSLLLGKIKNNAIKNPIIATTMKDPCKGAIL